MDFCKKSKLLDEVSVLGDLRLSHNVIKNGALSVFTQSRYSNKLGRRSAIAKTQIWYPDDETL